MDALMRHYGKKHNTLLTFQTWLTSKPEHFCEYVPLEQHTGKSMCLFAEI